MQHIHIDIPIRNKIRKAIIQPGGVFANSIISPVGAGVGENVTGTGAVEGEYVPLKVGDIDTGRDGATEGDCVESLKDGAKLAEGDTDGA